VTTSCNCEKYWQG